MIDAVDAVDRWTFIYHRFNPCLLSCLCVRRNPKFPLSDWSKGMTSAPLTVSMEVILLIQFHFDDDDDDVLVVGFFSETTKY